MFRKEKEIRNLRLPNRKKWSSIWNGRINRHLLRHQWWIFRLKNLKTTFLLINRKRKILPYLTKVKEWLWYLNRLFPILFLLCRKTLWKRRNPDLRWNRQLRKKNTKDLNSNRIILLRTWKTTVSRLSIWWSILKMMIRRLTWTSRMQIKTASSIHCAASESKSVRLKQPWDLR